MANNKQTTTKGDNSRRAKPMVPKAGFTKHRSRYDEGGKIKK